jgi:hypothetical protein
MASSSFAALALPFPEDWGIAMRLARFSHDIFKL